MTNALHGGLGHRLGGAVVQRFGQARQQAIAADPTEAVVIPPELEAAAYHLDKTPWPPLAFSGDVGVVSLYLFADKSPMLGGLPPGYWQPW